MAKRFRPELEDEKNKPNKIMDAENSELIRLRIRVEELNKYFADAANERDELRRQNEQLREALTHICEQGWIEHDPDCAEDDTCSCTGASLVRKALIRNQKE